MLAIFDIQHAGKPGKRDLGASHDLDGDGLVEANEHEARLTPLYVKGARAMLEPSGVRVEVLEDGAYSTRHRRAAELAKEHGGPVAYVACHLNAGGGDYGLVCYDYRSGNGSTLATELARKLRKRLAEHGVRRVLTGATAPAKRPSGSLGVRWDLLPKYNGATLWPRPYSTIQGIYKGPANLSGVCFEPVFMDSHAHVLDEAGLELLGRCLASGLLSYFAKVSRVIQ
jgi:hypothetical protein